MEVVVVTCGWQTNLFISFRAYVSDLVIVPWCVGKFCVFISSVPFDKISWLRLVMYIRRSLCKFFNAFASVIWSWLGNCENIVISSGVGCNGKESMVLWMCVLAMVLSKYIVQVAGNVYMCYLLFEVFFVFCHFWLLYN